MNLKDLINTESIKEEVERGLKKLKDVKGFDKIIMAREDEEFSSKVIGNRFLLQNLNAKESFDISDEEIDLLNLILMQDHITKIGYIPENYYSFMSDFYNKSNVYKEFIDNIKLDGNYMLEGQNIVYRFPFTVYKILNYFISTNKIPNPHQIDNAYQTNLTANQGTEYDIFINRSLDLTAIRNLFIYMGLYNQTKDDRFIDELIKLLSDKPSGLDKTYDEFLNENHNDVYYKLDIIFPTVTNSTLEVLSNSGFHDVIYKRDTKLLPIISDILEVLKEKNYNSEIIQYLVDKLSEEELENSI